MSNIFEVVTVHCLVRVSVCRSIQYMCYLWGCHCGVQHCQAVYMSRVLYLWGCGGVSTVRWSMSQYLQYLLFCEVVALCYTVKVSVCHSIQCMCYICEIVDVYSAVSWWVRHNIHCMSYICEVVVVRGNVRQSLCHSIHRMCQSVRLWQCKVQPVCYSIYCMCRYICEIVSVCNAVR